MIERLLPFFATLLAGTLRFRWQGDALPANAILMFWHGKMFGGWYSVRRRHPVALVSKSKDGRFLSAVLARWGYKLARGSSGKKGMEALEEAMALIRSGNADSLVITPDGPRGPRHSFKRGAFIAACELDLPLYMLSITYGSFKELKSWDRFEVPMPFSRVTIQVTKVDISALPAEPELQRSWLDALSSQFDT